MSTNVYFSPINVQFKPLPEFTISLQWFAKRFSRVMGGFENNISPESAVWGITPIKFAAYVNSYIFSPNILIPLQLLGMWATLDSTVHDPLNKTVSLVFQSIFLALIAKYTNDGTLRKFSNDLHAFSKDAKETIKHLEAKRGVTEVTFDKPPQITVSPQATGCVRSIIGFINRIIAKIFNALFFWR